MDQSPIINITEQKQDVLNFAFLKEKAIQQLQALTGKIWTDYNIHDPGINILENLCFTLTELGYRTRFSVEDILTAKKEDDKTKDVFYPAHQALTSSPITINDYRKILLDIDGIKNAIIYPSKKYPDFDGIYDVDIVLFGDSDDQLSKSIIKQEVILELNMNRNLCEDFNNINFIENDLLKFEIDLEIKSTDSISDLIIEVYKALENYISPAINFYGLQEMLDRGFSTDKIFDGPFLRSGFILQDELDQLKIKQEIYVSDIIHIMMDIEGISLVKKILITDFEGKKQPWVAKVENGKAPRFDINNSIIRFFNLGKEIKLKENIQKNIFKITRQESQVSVHKRLKILQNEGNYRAIDEYYSIQNDFPQVYGIGKEGLENSATPLRKAQAKQLKGYLLFFEQFITNYLAQLQNLRKLFSIDNIEQSFFSQPLFEVPGIEYLYQPFLKYCIKNNIDFENSKTIKKEWKKYKEKNTIKICNTLNQITEDKSTFIKRRNRILDHLLSRFAFSFAACQFDFFNDEDKKHKHILHKTNILQHYIDISKNRTKAFKNIFADKDDESNISGFENRLNILLGLNGNSKKFPIEFFNNQLSINNSNIKSSNQSPYALIFPENTKKDAVNLLFHFGIHSKNYKINELEYNTYSIDLFDRSNKIIAKVNRMFTSKQEVEDYINKSTTLLSEISQNCESLHIFERILYRPIDNLNYFRFNILNADIYPIFHQTKYLDFQDRTEILKQIFDLGCKTDNYSVIQTAPQQYKISLNNASNQLLITNNFYNTIPIAQEEIKKQSEHFLKFKNNEIPENKIVKYYTRHHDIFRLKSNPYAFIINIFIPDWNWKFQDERFRTHVENLIKHEIPAYILPVIKWVGINEIVEIIKLSDQYQELKLKRNPDLENLQNVLDKIFELFL